MNLPSAHQFERKTRPTLFLEEDFQIPELSRDQPGPSSRSHRPDIVHQDSRDDFSKKDRISAELEDDGKGDEIGGERGEGEDRQGSNRVEDTHGSNDAPPPPPPPASGPAKSDLTSWETVKKNLKNHLSFIGPGIIASVAYADPGNWATDLEAGSEFGYKLLFAVLLSGLFAILLQILCVRLGIITGLDLAKATRQLVLGESVDYNRQCPDGYPRAKPSNQKIDKKSWNYKVRLVGLWCLYIITEGAIIATELAELIGSAIALNMLFPSLPLWAGVLVTSFDVFLILFIYRPGNGIRAFELLIGFLVLIVLSCFIALLVKVDPNWADVFHGYVPSSTLVDSKAPLCCRGNSRSSHFALTTRIDTSIDEKQKSTQRSMGLSNQEDETEREMPNDVEVITETEQAPARWTRSLQNLISRAFPSIDMATIVPVGATSKLKAARVNASNFTHSLGISGGPKIPDIDFKPGNNYQRPQASLKHVRLHLPHASWDQALSLVFFAITINSAILIVAGAAFFYSQETPGNEVVADLHDAFVLLSERLGKVFGILFAVALLAAGQSASLTVTLAGQIISEGFINWKTSPFARRVITRSIAMLPSLLVATIVGKDGLDQMLVASQVALSMALPFVSFPLVFMTGSKLWMRLWEPQGRRSEDADGSDIALSQTISDQDDTLRQRCLSASSVEPQEQEQEPQRDLERGSSGILHLLHNKLPVSILAWLVFAVIVLADGYVLITLFLGEN